VADRLRTFGRIVPNVSKCPRFLPKLTYPSAESAQALFPARRFMSGTTRFEKKAASKSGSR